MGFGSTSETATGSLPLADERRDSASMRDDADQAQVSIVVVSYNAREVLKVCLRSIYNHPPATSFEVIVVDNASTDGSPEMVESCFPEVRLLRSDSNRGYASACNYGARSSEGRMLLFLNSDIEVTPGALELLYGCLDKREGAVVCGGRLESYDGSPQPSCRRFPTHLSIPFSRGSVLSKFPFLKRLPFGFN